VSDFIPSQYRTADVVGIFQKIVFDGAYWRMPILLEAMEEAEADASAMQSLLKFWMCAQPGNDEPRLLWADSVGGERGEFVRVGVELARLGPPADDLKRCLNPRRSHMGGEGAVGGLYKGTPFAACMKCEPCANWNRLDQREQTLRRPIAREYEKTTGIEGGSWRRGRAPGRAHGAREAGPVGRRPVGDFDPGQRGVACRPIHTHSPTGRTSPR
jgi:hypothetical protein